MNQYLATLSTDLNTLRVKISAAKSDKAREHLIADLDRCVAALVESDDPTYFTILADAGVDMATTARALVRHANRQYQTGWREGSAWRPSLVRRAS